MKRILTLVFSIAVASPVYGNEIFLPPDPVKETRAFSGPNDIVLIKFTTWSGYRKIESIWIDSDSTENHPKVTIGTYDETNNIFSPIAELNGPDESERYIPLSDLILETDREYCAKFEFQNGVNFNWHVWVPYNQFAVVPGFVGAQISQDAGATWIMNEDLGFEFSASLRLRQIPEISFTLNNSNEFEINFIGVLQVSSDLESWDDAPSPYVSPQTFIVGDEPKFYRAKEE